MKRALVLVVAGLLAAAGCGSAQQAAPAAPAPTETVTLNVSAAASLTATFTELSKQFETDNPGVKVALNFGASSDLAQQIVQGSPSDVFAAANTSTMKTVTDAGLATNPQVFVTNVLEIATQPGNPKGITGFADLAKPGLTVVVCAPQVPCGAATEKIEQSTGVTLTPVSEEPDVKSTLAKVTTGNADAGVVYATDVIDAGAAVQGVPFPEAQDAVNEYPIAALTNAPQPEEATKFVDFVLSEQGKKVFEAAGFGTP
ncbi:molybdate ABC transporter substrate-binding protein [Pseudonocardia sp.]|uniref:molybdate ABC transporter substrate-binding protein n=1 Tax=Pseudonocardia sp. TaxID=60912 RepID=UPI003D09A9A5